MSDSITIDVDDNGVEAALNGLADKAQAYVNAGAQETAEAMVREMRSRLERQLGSGATGKTVAGITSRPAYDGNGYIVIAERDPFPSLPFWLEKGTVHMKPHSFFYASALLEVHAHERRMREALAQAIAAQGLGE